MNSAPIASGSTRHRRRSRATGAPRTRASRYQYHLSTPQAPKNRAAAAARRRQPFAHTPLSFLCVTVRDFVATRHLKQSAASSPPTPSSSASAFSTFSGRFSSLCLHHTLALLSPLPPGCRRHLGLHALSEPVNSRSTISPPSTRNDAGLRDSGQRHRMTRQPRSGVILKRCDWALFARLSDTMTPFLRN